MQRDLKTTRVTPVSCIFRAGIENISVMFTKPDKRASWEESFNEAKQKLGEWDCNVIHEGDKI